MITELKAQLELTSSIERTNSHSYLNFRHLVFLLGETEKAVKLPSSSEPRPFLSGGTGL